MQLMTDLCYCIFTAWRARFQQISLPLTFPWPLWNSLTFPGFPGEWSPWTQQNKTTLV